MRDMPTSDELIRRAKEDFAPTVYAKGYPATPRHIEEMIAETMHTDAMGEAMATTMGEAVEDGPMMDPVAGVDEFEEERPWQSMPATVPDRERRVEHMTVQPSAPYPATAQSTTTGSGRGIVRAVGWFIMLAVIGFWVLLLVGLAGDPGDAVSSILGGVLLTTFPLIISALMIRTSRDPKQPNGIVS